MGRLGRVFGSGHIQVALATGISLVLITYLSRRVMSRPVPDFWLAAPPLLMALYEGVSKSRGGTWYARASTWVAAIALATIAIVVLTWS